MPSSVNPVELWRDAYGGRRASELPPPPGEDGPYPNLGTIPPRPQPPSAEQRRQIMAALEAERTAARAPALPGMAPRPALPQFEGLPPDTLDPIPSPPPPAPDLAPEPPVILSFPAGGASPATEDAGRLRELAAAAGGRRVAITGYGDATATDPASQAAGLALGLRRAQAVASVLTAAGLTQGRIAVEAAPAGRGAEARILY